MNALVEFDEKEFWIQLFSIVARREERTEDEDVDLYSHQESQPQMNVDIRR
ncbi:MAG TPA: hypothetical protein VF020_22825 [Chthoniobacterales bacterium]